MVKGHVLHNVSILLDSAVMEEVSILTWSTAVYEDDEYCINLSQYQETIETQHLPQRCAHRSASSSQLAYHLQRAPCPLLLAILVVLSAQKIRYASYRDRSQELGLSLRVRQLIV